MMSSQEKERRKKERKQRLCQWCIVKYVDNKYSFDDDRESREGLYLYILKQTLTYGLVSD